MMRKAHNFFTIDSLLTVLSRYKNGTKSLKELFHPFLELKLVPIFT